MMYIFLKHNVSEQLCGMLADLPKIKFLLDNIFSFLPVLLAKNVGSLFIETVSFHPTGQFGFHQWRSPW